MTKAQEPNLHSTMSSSFKINDPKEREDTIKDLLEYAVARTTEGMVLSGTLVREKNGRLAITTGWMHQGLTDDKG